MGLASWKQVGEIWELSDDGWLKIRDKETELRHEVVEYDNRDYSSHRRIC